jgi:hypothetical protein
VGRAGHSLCSNSFLDAFVRKPAACWTRRRGSTFGSVGPTPISSPVAKGHAQPGPRPPKSSFIPSIDAVKALQIGFIHHKENENTASHQAKWFCPLQRGEMQNITECKIFFISNNSWFV